MGTLIGIIVGAAVFGLVIGGLGRLLVPGKQDLSLWRTFVIGFAGALAGSIVAEIFDVLDTSGIDWIQWALQAGFAAVGVILYLRNRALSS